MDYASVNYTETHTLIGDEAVYTCEDGYVFLSGNDSQTVQCDAAVYPASDPAAWSTPTEYCIGR